MKRHARRLLLISVSIAAALWMTTHTAHTQTGTVACGVTDLGTIGGHITVGLAISDGGLPSVAGYGQTPLTEFHAFSGNAGRIFDIGTLGGSRSEARATQLGWVAGISEVPSGHNHAFRYEGYGPLIDMGTLGGTLSYANGMAAGATTMYIVGSSLTSGDAVTRPFIWDATTEVMSELAVSLGGPNATAIGVNGLGHVVGYADTAVQGTRHAFLYANGVTQDLGSFGYGSEAYAVNATDVVVGRSWDFGPERNHAFRYQNGVMEDLGTLGGEDSEARDVSDDGTIVGWAHDPQGVMRAFIWRDGVMTDLNALISPEAGWVLVNATGINDHGAIVGYGYHENEPRAFLLTPPIDLRANLRVHNNLLDTNFPNPHEAGQLITMGVTVEQARPLFMATGVTVVDTLTGPVEIVGWYGDGVESCVQDGLQLTCQIKPVDFSKDLMVRVRATGPGVITHSATVTADQPDPNLSNNSGTESNTAVSLASLAISATTIVGGQSSLARATLTSPTPQGGATVHLTSSNPAVASVPSQFDVLPGCCDGGLWREFYVTTATVSSPVTVDVTASYGLVTKAVTITVVPAGTSFPYGGTPWPIPGTIQAENYDMGGEGIAYHDLDSGNNGGAYRADDVDIEATGDEDGGANVGWTGAGEWLAYTVNVAAAGSYTLEARVASLGSAGTFHVEVDGVDKTGTMAVPDTSGWQVWTTVSHAVTLDAGTHALRVRFDTNGTNGTVGNLNYLRFTGGGGGPTPYGGTPWPIPGTIQAEDFDNGGEGVAYHDWSPQNSGGEYRATAVDVQSTADAGDGHNVGWIVAGEWLVYSVNVASAGNYFLDVRVASPGQGGTYHVDVDGVDATGTIVVPDTGGWQVWATTRVTLSLAAGAHLLRVSFDTNGASGAVGNLNYMRFTAAGTPTPYGGAPAAVPGRIEAENFDEGGSGVAYYDTTAGNTGGEDRATDVDIQATSDAGGGYNVGWMAPLEWLNYTVAVAQTGTYTLTARVAANGAGGTFHVDFNGVDKTGSLTIPATGGWQVWVDVTAAVSLTAGVQSMRFVSDTAGPGGVFGNLNYIDVTNAVPPPSATNIVLYSPDLTLHGAWSRASDASAAVGQKALTPDAGWSTTDSPLAVPTDYFEASFNAPANTPYTVWLRIRASGDTKYSDSVWVQFSDARAGGAVYPLGSSSGLLVNLEPCGGCGVSGWGWQNGAYWLAQASTITFATAGSHTIRVQVREDGAQIDQVILSPSQYLNAAPGPVTGDSTIVPK